MVFDAIGNVCDEVGADEDDDSCSSCGDDSDADADVEDNNGAGGSGKQSVRTSMSKRRVSKIVRDFREKKERELEQQAQLEKDKDSFVRKDRSDSFFVDYGFNPRR